jgi:hypothetical protein
MYTNDYFLFSNLERGKLDLAISSGEMLNRGRVGDRDKARTQLSD